MCVLVGSVQAYAGKLNHELIEASGWMLCDGRTVETHRYPELFAALEYSYGGQGNQFNIPDYRGLFLRGVDHSQGRDPDASQRTAQVEGANAGDLVGSLQGDSLKSHDHQLNETIGAKAIMSGNMAMVTVVESKTAKADILIAKNGGKETRPVNASVNYIIKYCQFK